MHVNGFSPGTLDLDGFFTTENMHFTLTGKCPALERPQRQFTNSPSTLNSGASHLRTAITVYKRLVSLLVAAF